MSLVKGKVLTDQVDRGGGGLPAVSVDLRHGCDVWCVLLCIGVRKKALCFLVATDTRRRTSVWLLQRLFGAIQRFQV